MSQRPEIVTFADLGPEDFARHPVWIAVLSADRGEPWYDECDEEMFRPRTIAPPASPAEGTLLVAASFMLADGSKLPGFVTPAHEDDPADDERVLATMQPSLFLESGRKREFWSGTIAVKAEARRAFYTELGREPASVFPIRFSVESGLAKGRTCGRVLGFYSSYDPKLPPTIER